jgi:hypothetical protein
MGNEIPLNNGSHRRKGGARMSIQGHTVTWGSHVDPKTQRASWLQRLRQWLAAPTAKNGRVPPVALYGSWDAKREKFHPITAESALDQVAAQRGQSWSIGIHGAAL